MKFDVNRTVQDLLRQDARIQDLYFNISEMRLSITSLYIISDAHKYDIIWTENRDVIDSFISEILKYESSIIVSSTEKLWAVLFMPTTIHENYSFFFYVSQMIFMQTCSQ